MLYILARLCSQQYGHHVKAERQILSEKLKCSLPPIHMAQNSAALPTTSPHTLTSRQTNKVVTVHVIVNVSSIHCFSVAAVSVEQPQVWNMWSAVKRNEILTHVLGWVEGL